MIILNQTDIERFELIDAIFSSVSIEELRNFSEREQIVAKLKGSNNIGFFKTLLQEHNMQQTEISRMATELNALKSDTKVLIEVINKTLCTPYYNQDFQNLKNKHNIY